jgi:hypothetical protein
MPSFRTHRAAFRRMGNDRVLGSKSEENEQDTLSLCPADFLLTQWSSNHE